MESDDILSAITFAINSPVNTSTNYSPYEALYGFRPISRCHLHLKIQIFNGLHQDYHSYMRELIKILEIIRSELTDNAEKHGNLMKDRCNKKVNKLVLNTVEFSSDESCFSPVTTFGTKYLIGFGWRNTYTTFSLSIWTGFMSLSAVGSFNIII
jgi:hypothetical protein